jgi:pSer/pThr/pTyr-binding forkhead associated (FHA) protein
VPVAVLTVLKFCLLALIFLFLTRVLRAVWVEITAPLPTAGTGGASLGVAPNQDTKRRTAAKPNKQSKRSEKAGPLRPTQLTVVEPPELLGTIYPLEPEMTLGRAPGCAVVITDSFASQLHARIFNRDDKWFVEDLGSRNGTWLNRNQVHGPLRIEPGDRIRVGDTVLEMNR